MRPWLSATEFPTSRPTRTSPTPSFNEAVAFSHGIPEAVVLRQHGAIASMRPWLSATEFGYSLSNGCKTPSCFNEAVAFSHGIQLELSELFVFEFGFNEAVAFSHGIPFVE